MKNAMVIRDDKGRKKEFHLCSACPMTFIAGEERMGNEEAIPIFYSEKHAFDAGWRHTSDPVFSENGQPVWVCPKCWSGGEL